MIIEKKKKSVKNNASISNEIKLANGTSIPVGAVVWKPGHVGNYVGNQMVVEARSEFVDVEVNPIGSRDFTYCLLLPGIQYRVYQGDGAVEDSILTVKVIHRGLERLLIQFHPECRTDANWFLCGRNSKVVN